MRFSQRNTSRSLSSLTHLYVQSTTGLLFTRVTPSITEKVVSGDVFSVSTRERKIGEIGPEVKVQFIWHVTAGEWEESRLGYQATKGHSRGSEFLFRLLVILGSNFGPTVGYRGFGGLGVACWPLVPTFVGSNPAEAVGFLGQKKSSTRLPSEGK